MVRPARLEDATVIAELLGEVGYPALGEAVERRLTSFTALPALPDTADRSVRYWKSVD